MIEVAAIVRSGPSICNIFIAKNVSVTLLVMGALKIGNQSPIRAHSIKGQDMTSEGSPGISTSDICTPLSERLHSDLSMPTLIPTSGFIQNQLGDPDVMGHLDRYSSAQGSPVAHGAGYYARATAKFHSDTGEHVVGAWKLIRAHNLTIYDR